MNEQVVTDLLQSKQWASAQIVSIAGEQVILGWVENMDVPLIISVMSESDEVDVHTLWDKVEQVKAEAKNQESVKNLLPGASTASFRTYLAIVASDSTISYYLVAKRSLSLDELPKKAIELSMEERKRAVECTHPEELDEHYCEKCHLAKHIPHIPIYGTYNMQGIMKEGEEYNWCACGYSKEQPWCDGTCNTDKPELVDENGNQKFCGYRFKVNKQQTIFTICGCKYTRTPPLCDGTHGPMPANPDVPPCRCDLAEDKKLSW